MVKRKFFTSPRDPFVTSDVSDVQNCGKTQIFYVAARPFRHFGRVGRSKLWKNANFSRGAATLSSLRTCRTLKTVEKRKFWNRPSNPFVTSDVSEAQNCGKTRIPRLTIADLCAKTVVKWTFLTGLDRTTVENCGKMDVFDRTEPDYGGKLW